MTKKDYEGMAKTFAMVYAANTSKDDKRIHSDECVEYWKNGFHSALCTLTAYLSVDNERFDKDKFFEVIYPNGR